MIDLIKIVLLATPLLCVAGAFVLHRMQCIEAQDLQARKNGTQTVL
jgi:hypothetical protein